MPLPVRGAPPELQVVCSRPAALTAALRDMFVLPEVVEVCPLCRQPWSLFLRHLSLFCETDGVWADAGCPVAGCACPAGSSRPESPEPHSR